MRVLTIRIFLKKIKERRKIIDIANKSNLFAAILPFNFEKSIKSNFI